MNKQRWQRGGWLLLMLLFLTTALPLKADDDDDDDKRDRYQKTRDYQRKKKDKNSSETSVTGTQTLSIQSTGLQISPTSVVMSKGSSAYITVSNPYGSVRVESHETSIVRAYYDSTNSRVVLSARGTGKTELTIRDRRSELKVPVTVVSESTPPPPPPPSSGGDYTLLAWNDLGMHCVDGKDYSVFSILPPYNNLIAQLLDKNGGLVTEGVELTYESLASTIKDDQNNDIASINTYSAPTEVGQIEKTNFWDYVLKLFGGSPAPNHGLNLNDPTISNRTPGVDPLPMEFNAGRNWFQAEGLPITPIDDSGNKNFYPMVKVTALDDQGNVLATTKTVLPVSDEMTCKSCHSSTNDPAELANAAKPASGWTFDSDAEKDWKFNILKRHDDKLQGSDATANLYKAALAAKGFSADGLYATATDDTNATPVLCASCHGSNALGTTSYPGVQPLTQALHGSHGEVKDPSNGIKLNDSANRDSCYLCHPGSETQCLRGAMGNAKDDQGNAAMSCQSCHGDMEAVGSPTRQGWFEEPTCQSCHHDGERKLSSLDDNGDLIVPQDKTFASNDNTPAQGLNLYRFSTGHGDLQCESCHGATHAVYPSSHEEDNLQSIELQGHAGTVNECTACHTNVPLTTNGGPHGMHTIGDAWIDRHEDVAERNTQSCAYCHGSDFRGSPLSEVKVEKTFRVDGRNKTFKAGDEVGCYDCHNGPGG